MDIKRFGIVSNEDLYTSGGPFSCSTTYFFQPRVGSDGKFNTGGRDGEEL
jgi:hypothetical protein